MPQYEGRHRINPVDALFLRGMGYSWAKIARVLSDKLKRSPPFQPDSVKSAVSKYRKRNKRDVLDLASRGL